MPEVSYGRFVKGPKSFRSPVSKWVALQAGRGPKERLDLAPERGRHRRKPHEGEQAVDGAKPEAPAPVERGHEARIAQRLDAETPGAGAGPFDEGAEKGAELAVKTCHGART